MNTNTITAELLRRPIAYHSVVAKAFGSAKYAIFWSQLYYWHDKGSDPEGWIKKDQAEWFDETGLSRREQETARKIGRDLGLHEERLAGNPATMTYRINLEKSFEAIAAYIAAHPRKKAPKPKEAAKAPETGLGPAKEAKPTPREQAVEFFAQGPIYQRAAAELTGALPPDKQEIITAELEKFVDYWTEPTGDGKKQLWQTKKTFEVGRRLKNWLSRCNEYRRIEKKISGMVL